MPQDKCRFKVLCKMHFSYIPIVFLVCFCQCMHCSPTSQRMLDDPTPKCAHEDFTAMGRGLSEIPRGDSCTKTLNLAYNHYATLPELEFQNRGFKILTDIDLHENKIADIESQAFRGLRKLVNIDLSYNNLSYIHPYTFKYNPRLEKLDLTNNQIKFDKLGVFLMSSSLETLILVSNRIEQLYELTFVGVPNLTNLILDNNMLLITIAPNTFKPMTDIEYLSLANTGVSRLSKTMFKTHPNVINLESTPLADKFNPPLCKIRNRNVTILLNMDDYFV